MRESCSGRTWDPSDWGEVRPWLVLLISRVDSLDDPEPFTANRFSPVSQKVWDPIRALN